MEKKDHRGFFYLCEGCGHRYQKTPGWLERPEGYQEKIRSYFSGKLSKKERASRALSL